MFKNYFKIAFRNLKQNKTYLFLNVSGLAVGIAASLLLFTVILFELSFDNFHRKKDSIYRIGTEFHTQDGVEYSDGVPFPVGPALRLDFPQIKEVASIFKQDGMITVPEDKGVSKKFNESHFYYAEPEFFEMFDFEWISGNPATALKDPNQVVLSQELAEKYFGDWKSALGKTIIYNNRNPYTVSGILKNTPVNSDFPLGLVVAYSAIKRTGIANNLNDWVSIYGGHYTFVVLPAELTASSLNLQFMEFAKKHKPAAYAQDAPFAQPLTEIHFNDQFGNFNDRVFSKTLIRALALIGIFLILIACVNFINLATAQAVNRSKEVGVRKVLGSNRVQLGLQFLGETTLITGIAMVIAISLAQLTLPFLNQLLNTRMTIDYLNNPALFLFILLVSILVIVCSGVYPAIILSGFNPVTALKNKITSRMVGGISLRRGLVVIQFAIAQVLIIGTLIVVSQMNYFRTASLGFDRASIVNVQLPHDSLSKSRYNYVRDQLKANPDIQQVSFSYASPTSDGNWSSDFNFNHDPKTTPFSANLKWADVDYFKTYNLEFVAGRPYVYQDTVSEFVVNETLLSKLGITNPQDAIGKEISFWDGRKVANISGVIRDFNAYSLREPMAAVVLGSWRDMYRTINIKLRPGVEKRVLPRIEKLWTEAFPDYAYQYQFLDETINNFYRQERQLSALYKIFAGIAVFISCLGLYGLVSFMAVRRTREMGIRKVLGASPMNIVYLLSKEFTVLILLAFILSGPVSYYVMKGWLQNYTYRISMEASMFVLAVLGSILVAWITVGQRAIRAAGVNPVKSLKTE